MKPTFIGISGRTGSGKTHLSKLLVKEFGEKKITRIELDSYYKDNSKLSLIDREEINYDHPKSIDRKLLEKQLIQLNNWENIHIPNYDFSTHTRMNSKRKVTPKEIIIFDGLFPDICFIRRLERDIAHRGRSLNSTIKQYLKSVRPMYNKYIKPTQDLADITIDYNQDFSTLIDRIKFLMDKNS